MTSGTIACGELCIPRTALLERAARVSAGLSTLHVEGGDRVVILSHNRTEFLEISLGTGRVGAYAVPINWHLKRGEIDVLLDDCQPKLIFIEANLLAEAPADWLDRVTTIVLDDARGAPRDYATWRDSFEPSTLPASPAPGSMMYTSGTTGRSKGVQRSPATLEQQRELNAVRAALYNMHTTSRVVVPGPLYHALPNQFAMHAALEAELLLICERFDAEDLLGVIERERITTTAVAPIMFVRLLRLPETVRRRYDLSSLNWVLHAGGPCPPDVKRAMIEWWGPVIAEYYGGTETGPLTLCESAEWLSHPGTCGRPLPQARIRIVDRDGKDVPRGQPGEVFGRLLPNPDFTYRNDPQKRVDVGLGDLVSLGDVGYQDEEGYLYLCDRARDMIVSGGVNIYPAEVEAALLSLPGVEDCAIIGVPDPEFGESVVGFASGTGLDAAKLRAQLRERIAGFKTPREIFVLPSLGRDASGKLKKAQLRSRYDELMRARLA
jgi:long-chain acyl-CoA synthetase